MAKKRKSVKKKSVRSSSKTVKPIRSSKEQIEKSLKSAKYFIKYSLSTDARQLMNKIVRLAKQGYDSKKVHSSRGKYLPYRIKVHNIIINRFLRQDTRTKKPDVYVFGGVAGSGKSSVLARFVKERALTINNDDIKKALSKYDPSPLKKYPLIHAPYLHEESSDIEKKLLEKAVMQRKDIILDRTLASYVKNRRLLKDLHNKGYGITILGTNLPPHIALIRTSARFIKKGRYVPLDIIADKGNKTNASVIKMAKQEFVKRARVYNTTKKKPKLMYRKGR